jgi:hypothetical protein
LLHLDEAVKAERVEAVEQARIAVYLLAEEANEARSLLQDRHARHARLYIVHHPFDRPGRHVGGLTHGELRDDRGTGRIGGLVRW